MRFLINPEDSKICEHCETVFHKQNNWNLLNREMKNILRIYKQFRLLIPKKIITKFEFFKWGTTYLTNRCWTRNPNFLHVLKIIKSSISAKLKLKWISASIK